MMPVALIYRFEANITEMVPIGLVPEGIRVDAYFSGPVLEGRLSGSSVRGIDYLLLRADGIGVVDSYSVITTAAAQNISYHSQGYIVPPPEVQMPPPEVMLSAEFQWPDVPLPLHGFVLYRTGVDDLAWLNRSVLAFEGTVNVGTGQLIIEVRALHHTAAEQAGLTTP